MTDRPHLLVRLWRRVRDTLWDLFASDRAEDDRRKLDAQMHPRQGLRRNGFGQGPML